MHIVEIVSIITHELSSTYIREIDLLLNQKFISNKYIIGELFLFCIISMYLM